MCDFDDDDYCDDEYDEEEINDDERLDDVGDLDENIEPLPLDPSVISPEPIDPIPEPVEPSPEPVDPVRRATIRFGKYVGGYGTTKANCEHCSCSEYKGWRVGGKKCENCGHLFEDHN